MIWSHGEIWCSVIRTAFSSYPLQEKGTEGAGKARWKNAL